jgi:RNA polymerase sigma-70 factor (ECF subfamily)
VWRSAFAIAKGELRRRRRNDARTGAEFATGYDAAGDDAGGDERVDDLLARLSTLTATDREIIVLCHVAGWHPGELAGVMGEPAGRIRVRLHRATERARLALEQEQN